MTNTSTERQRQAIRTLAGKAGVQIERDVEQLSREEASDVIDQLMMAVDGGKSDVPRLLRPMNGPSQAARARMGLAAKLVYGRMARMGADPLDNPGSTEVFRREVMKLHEVLLELEEEGGRKACVSEARREWCDLTLIASRVHHQTESTGAGHPCGST